MTAYDGTHEGTYARYRCNDGYSLRGATHRRCGSDGRWGRTEPTCEGEIISMTMHCNFKSEKTALSVKLSKIMWLENFALYGTVSVISSPNNKTGYHFMSAATRSY